jgi:hypothetical protein
MSLLVQGKHCEQDDGLCVKFHLELRILKDLHCVSIDREKSTHLC